MPWKNLDKTNRKFDTKELQTKLKLLPGGQVGAIRQRAEKLSFSWSWKSRDNANGQDGHTQLAVDRDNDSKYEVAEGGGDSNGDGNDDT